MLLSYSIGELAAAAGVAASTLRYYERAGLLPADGRSESNYRIYGQRSLERLRFIRAAQGAGLALEDVKHLLALRAGGMGPCREVRDLLQRRLAEAEQRLLDLRRVRSALRASLATCEQAEPAGRCQVFADLERGHLGAPRPAPRASRKRGKAQP
jgi:DNA-binding transcriptional MerR regulator